MKKRSFTLIEVMISVVLMGIIISYLYGTLGGLRHSNMLLENRDKILSKDEVLLNLLNRDLLETKELKISGTKSLNYILELRTKNSLYNSNFVYVKWFLNIDSNLLIRAESTKKFKLPVLIDNLHFVKFDIFAENIEMFKVYKSSKGKSILISTKDMNTSEIFAIELINIKK